MDKNSGKNSAVSIRPLHDLFAGEVSGLDLREPLTDNIIEQLNRAIDEYAVLVFRDQAITDEQQKQFSRQFGPLEEPGSNSNITRPEDRRLGAGIADISNLDKSENILGRNDRQRMFNLGNQLWHSDSSYKPIPAKFSLLSGRAVPTQGGNTEFADMRAAYDRLDEPLKSLVEDLVCEHSLLYSRGALGFDELTQDEKVHFDPVYQRLVRTLPATGRKSLYLSSHAGKIVGWPTPEARLLLRDLTEAATRPELVYAHQWRTNDLVMWDNRQTMHRARPFADTAEVRDMRRTTVAGVEPTVDQQQFRAA